jgi:hypothetical protein
MVVTSLLTAALLACDTSGDQRLDQLPQLVRHQPITTTRDHASKVKCRIELDLVPLTRTRGEEVDRLWSPAPCCP